MYDLKATTRQISYTSTKRNLSLFVLAPSANHAFHPLVDIVATIKCIYILLYAETRIYIPGAAC